MRDMRKQEKKEKFYHIGPEGKLSAEGVYCIESDLIGANYVMQEISKEEAEEIIKNQEKEVNY
jgi:hypothetical protein